MKSQVWNIRGKWLLPVTGAPVNNGYVRVEKGRIADIGSGSPPAGGKELGGPDVAILPGLVNAHAHLELSRACGKIPKGLPFADWIREVIRFREGMSRQEIPVDVLQGANELLMGGTTCVGDHTDGGSGTAGLLESGLRGVSFHETIGFRSADAPARLAKIEKWLGEFPKKGRVRPGVAPHAPYTVSPELLQGCRDLSRKHRFPLSVHLSETPEEVRFLKDGTGPLRELLEERRAWDPDWKPPGVSPVRYLDDLGLLDRRFLAVHLNRLEKGDLSRLLNKKAHVVHCPGSHAFFARSPFPLREFVEADLPPAIGTDSCASNLHLNLFEEMHRLYKSFPDVDPSRILAMATIRGAEALGLGKETGSIETGKHADLIGILIPDDLDMDPSEWAVSRAHQVIFTMVGGTILHGG